MWKKKYLVSINHFNYHIDQKEQLSNNAEKQKSMCLTVGRSWDIQHNIPFYNVFIYISVPETYVPTCPYQLLLLYPTLIHVLYVSVCILTFFNTLIKKQNKLWIFCVFKIAFIWNHNFWNIILISSFLMIMSNVVSFFYLNFSSILKSKTNNIKNQSIIILILNEAVLVIRYRTQWCI